MALSLDDALLGEKTHYYCSSSEDENDNDDDGSDREGASNGPPSQPTFIPEPEIGKYEGHSTNTGPKGVIKDWQRFKQLEVENRHEQERERQAIVQKLSMSCRSHLDDEREKQKDEDFMQQIELELGDLEDEFMKEYRQRRIEEMRRALDNVPKFGKLVPLSSGGFVESIDKENPTVTIVVHIYRDGVPACEAMNGCLVCLAEDYPHIKFCKISASDAKLSMNFAENGIPALLIYKQGELVGNFIRISDELGDDFFAADVESFLQEHGFLNQKGLSQVMQSCSIRQSRNQDDSDSDFDGD